MMVMKSLKSRRYVIGCFNWQWSYYSLNDAGVKYICEYLGLPDDVVPATYKKSKIAKVAETEGKEDGEEDTGDLKKKGDEAEDAQEVRA